MKGLIHWLAFILIIGFLTIATEKYIVEPYILSYSPYYEKFYVEWSLLIFSGLLVAAFWIGLLSVAVPSIDQNRKRRRFA